MFRNSPTTGLLYIWYAKYILPSMVVRRHESNNRSSGVIGPVMGSGHGARTIPHCFMVSPRYYH